MMQSAKLIVVAKKICADKSLSFIKRAGEGAYKETFHVKTAAGSSLALKVYKFGYTKDDRSEREIHAIKTCDHPGIAKLFDIDTFIFSGTSYLYSIEEFLSGGRLADKLNEHGLMSVSEVIDLGNNLISAVSHIASHRFVHRDLKPDNILFRGDDSSPVIVDFGLVRDLTAESLTKTWMMNGPGTPYYASPEQLTNDKDLIDWRSDQFSLGIVLSFCLFGKHPFANGSDSATVNHVFRHGAHSPEFIANATQLNLPALIKMLDPWPYGRYRTTEELSTAWSNQRSR